MNVRLAAIEYYLPAQVITNQTLVEAFGFEEDFIKNKLGIHERRRANLDESCHSLAHAATEKLLTEFRVERESISLLLMVTQNPDYKLPNVGSLLQTSLGLGDRLAAFDINLGCSGFIYALAAAKGLMVTCNFSRSLIVTSDPYSKILAPNDRTTIPLFGDAAAAVLLEAVEDDGIGEFDFGTDGTGAEALIVRTGGSKYPQPSAHEKDNFLFMDGRAIYTFMMKRVPQSVARCLEVNNLSMADIDFFVFHQASKYMLQSLMTRMKIPESKMVFALSAYGNTVSSAIPIALRSLINDPSHQGKRVLLCGFGVGLSWASVVIRL